MERSFATVEQRAIKANANIQKADAQTTKAIEKGAAQRLTAEEKAARQKETSAARGEKAAQRAAEREASAAERASTAKQRAAEKAATAQERANERAARSAEKAASREIAASERSNRTLGQRFARGVANTSTRFLAPYAPIASMARRTAGDLARGLGIDLNIGGAIQRNVERETLATALSNSGYQEHGTGPNATRVSGATLQKEAADIGIKNAMDPTDVLSAGRAFVGVTGNLDQSRKMMGDLAKVSKATNADMTDVSRAAAKINAQMADTPTKAEDTLNVVRLLAGQGKLGAAEMSDYARSIGQIAGSAHRFGGDTTKNIAELSAMSQLSQQKGYSKGSMQAATGITSFANVFSNAANVKTFAKTFGVTPDAMEKRLQTMSPEEIIKASLSQTKGDPLKMGALFKNARARAMTLPFEEAFKEGSGGKTDPKSVAAGNAAVDAAFKKLTEGAMSAGEVDKEFAAQMQTTASKAKIFQDKLDDVVQNVQARLLPALEKLEPYLLKAAEGLAKLVAWISEHPGTAIAVAIGASIMRANLEQVLRTGIERALLGPGAKNATGLGSAAGTLGGLLTIASLAITTATIGMALIDHFNTKEQDQQRAGAEGNAVSGSLNATAAQLLAKGDFKGAQEAARKASEAAAAGLKNSSDPRNDTHYMRQAYSMFLDQALGSGEGVLGVRKSFGVTEKQTKDAAQQEDAAAARNRDELLKEQKVSNDLLSQIKEALLVNKPPGITITPFGGGTRPQ